MSSIEKILELDKNEQVIKQIKRHPFGLIGIYSLGLLAILALLGLLYLAVSSEGGLLIPLSDSGYGIVIGFVILFVMLFTYIGSYVYRTNELVITNENLIQVLQFSLLSRQTSQLNLAKIQDVSVDQNGIFANLFNFGTIEIETAGEAANFRFKYAPHPNQIAKIVIEAHEDYIRNHPAGHNTYRI